MLRIALSNSLTWLHLLLVSLTFLHTASAAEYGVGFSLSSDYAVSSVYFANGSTQGIAKIEGSRAYKQMMQTQNCSFSKPFYCPRGETFGFQKECKSSFRDRLPPWLGGRAPGEVAEILSPMLLGLKIATESYLGSTLEAAEIVQPFYVSEQFLDSICLASSGLSIHVPFLLNAPNTLIGPRAHGLTEQCEWDGRPRRYFLSLEYSRSALTAMLLKEQCGPLDKLGGFHDTSIGTRHWSEGSWNDMERQLRDLIDVDSVRKSGIEALVLLGESGLDDRLREVLKKILLKDMVISTELRPGVVNDDDGKGMVDPLFAAAEGLASYCLEMLDEGTFWPWSCGQSEL